MIGNLMLIVPDKNCNLCPRLYEFRQKNQATYKNWHNAPVDSFGDIKGEILIVGLAPGLRGANRTGRPFTGDWAGDLLYETLNKYGFSTGTYSGESTDGLTLKNCRITNAVRCLPPANKPISSEIKSCNNFLLQEILGMPHLKAIVALGLVAHNATLDALRLRKAEYKFSHGSHFKLPTGLFFFSSYHCSRYNTNTKRLTPDMFYDIFKKIKASMEPDPMRS
jgi:uracil-DNA glycosylase family 4